MFTLIEDTRTWQPVNPPVDAKRQPLPNRIVENPAGLVLQQRILGFQAQSPLNGRTGLCASSLKLVTHSQKLVSQHIWSDSKLGFERGYCLVQIQSTLEAVLRPLPRERLRLDSGLFFDPSKK